MKGELTLKINFNSKKQAQDAQKALKKEINSNKRFSSEIKIQDNLLIINIKGEDMVALRATSNSFLRYLQVMEKL